MILIYFFAFFIISWILLLVIFSYSTYHRYFKIAGPGLLFYSILVGYLLFRFELHKFFVWQVGLSILFLINSYRRQNKVKALFDYEEDLQVKAELELSIEKTKKYHIISSATYLLGFSISYLYFLNITLNG